MPIMLAGAVCALAASDLVWRLPLLVAALAMAALGLLGAPLVDRAIRRVRGCNTYPAQPTGPLFDTLARPVGSGLGALTLAVALVVPLAWEELWRGRTWDSLGSACVPFVLALVVFGLCWTWALRPRARVACAVALLAACAIAVLEDVLFALVMAGVLLAVVLLMHRAAGRGAAYERARASVGAAGLSVPLSQDAGVLAAGAPVGEKGPAWPWHAPALMLAAGCFLAVYVVNRYGTALYRQANGAGLFGGQAGYALFVGVIAGTLLLVLVGAWVVAMTVRERDSRVSRLAPTPSQAQRLRGYLVGRGLRELEIDVVLLIASGASASEMAVALNYARSSVATARREAYRKLGVHSRDQLVIVLRAVLSA